MPNLKISIDVTKINKAALYKGKKGTYLNLVVWENRDGEDQYGNHYRVDQDLPKEMRDMGEKGAILGNGKNFGSSSRPQGEHPGRPKAPVKRPLVDPDLDGDDSSQIPF